MVDLLTRLSERLLHVARRGSARRRLSKARIGSVLFVCQGNVCRSPFAAAAFRRALTSTRSEEDLQVSSAGFTRPGMRPPLHALEAARRLGIDLSAHRSTLVESSDIRTADLVVVMSAEYARAIATRYACARKRILILGDLDPRPIPRRTITDPWAEPSQVFQTVYERIDRCARELAQRVAGAVPAPRSRFTPALSFARR